MRSLWAEDTTHNTLIEYAQLPNVFGFRIKRLLDLGNRIAQCDDGVAAERLTIIEIRTQPTSLAMVGLVRVARLRELYKELVWA